MTKHLDLDYCRAWASALAASGSYDGADAATLLPRIAHGVAMGADPATAASNITVSKGKVVLSATFQAARLIRNGKVRYDITHASEERVELTWYRNGEKVGTSTFTIAEAKRAGLTSKTVWANYPEDLLFARALTRGIRRHAPETLAGTPAYTAEEVGADVTHAIGQPVPLLAAAPGDPGHRCGPGETAPKPTAAQLDELRRLKNELAIPDDAWREIVKRRGGSRSAREFTPQEADDLIAALRHRVSTQQLQDGLDAGKRVEVTVGGEAASADAAEF